MSYNIRVKTAWACPAVSQFQDNDVTSWGNIDPNDADIEAMARLYVFDVVTKNMDVVEVDDEPIPRSFQEWGDIIGEELAWDLKQGNEWLTEDNFESFCGRVDALLPFFLENYEPIKDTVIWD